jgi:hypothetical protein
MTPVLLGLLLVVGVANYLLVAVLWFAAWGLTNFTSKPAMLGGALLAIIWPLSLPGAVLWTGLNAPRQKVKSLYSLVRMLLK